jgi:hypothetical protein
MKASINNPQKRDFGILKKVTFDKCECPPFANQKI